MDKAGGKKSSKIKDIPMLEDANDAGTRYSTECTLILTEGDSAKTLAVAGLGVSGRDKYGVFPLRGKLLNVREATHKQIMENAEVDAMVKILGLKYKQKYDSADDMKSLRYGKLMIMTDQDHDGSHIKGLIINFIHHNWPSLLKRNFIEEFITPIVKVTKGDQVISFYSLPELEEWKKRTANWKTYKIKYYKGLGTSTSAEAKEYFKNIERHRIKFQYNGSGDDDTITMAFSKKCIEARKDWLTNWMESCKRRKELGLDQDIIYGAAVRSITYTEFVNKELVLFSNLDNERSIPCIVDGLKPGQRKVLFTCFKRNDKREVKVAQLAGSVAEHSAYHHGEASLMSTIINLAQNYVGSNNINLLEPNGQFGTRLQGGKDSASPRYIFTMLSPLARLIYDKRDNPLLRNLFDDNQKIEPEWYCPIIPMILVNGAAGIGTGWSTQVPNYNPRDIVENIRRLIRGEEPKSMQPWYKNFRGEIIEVNPQKFAINGEVSILSEGKLEITELPIGTWTQNYKESVIEPMLNGSEKVQPILTGYKEYNTDSTVRFILEMTPGAMKKLEEAGIHRSLKLQTTTSLASMVLFDKLGCLKRYESAMEILNEYFQLRLELYVKRREYLIGMLTAEALKLSNQARFILEKCDGDLVVENKKKKLMIDELVSRKYDSDPVKAWQEEQKSLLEQEHDAEVRNNAENGEEEAEVGRDFDYLLGMKLWSLTLERKQDILKQRDDKHHELETLRAKTPAVLYQDDLDAFMIELDRVEQEERDIESGKVQTKQADKGKGAKGRGKAAVKSRAIMDTCPSPAGERIRPVIDELLKKEEAKAHAKVKKQTGAPRVKKEKKVDMDEFDRLAEDKDSLFDKINSSAEGKNLLVKKRAPKKSSDNLKQTKLDFSKATRPTKKKSQDSDSEFDDESSDKASKSKPKSKAPSKGKEDDDFIIENVSDDEVAATSSRPTGRRAAGAGKKIIIDSDSEEDDDSDDLLPASKPKATKPAARKPLAKEDTYILDSDSEGNSPAQASQQPAPAKKKRKSHILDSESEFDYSADEMKSNVKAKPKPKPKATNGTARKAAAPSKKPETFDLVSGDSDSDVVAKKPSKPSAAPKRNAAAKRKKMVFSDDSDSPSPSAADDSDDDFTPSPSKKQKV